MVAWNGSDFVAIGGGVVNLATDVIGTLPFANGGTGQITQQTAINALVGTQTANRVLRSDGTNSTLSQVALATDVSGTLPVANGGTGQTTYTDGQLLIGNSTGNTLTKATLTASTGISVTNGTGSITITNTAPDQTVSLTGGGATTITGTYPNFTISSVNTTYSTATTTTDGLIKLGDGTVQTTTANTVSSDASRTYAIQLNGSGQAVVNVPWASGSGTITGVTGTSPVLSSGGTAPAISLASGYGDTQNPYASKTANHVLAAPNGSAGAPTFRALVAADITGTILISGGGTNSTATPTSGGVAYGNGTAYAFTAAGTSGQVLTSSGSGAPTWSTPASAGVSSISFASTGLTPSTATTGAVTVGGILGVANGGTNLSSYTANGVLYASGASTLASGNNFVFDGTNVGIGTSSPSTYGKFVVGGAASFTSSLVSTSATLTDKATLEFRKTTNVNSGQLSNVGNIVFIGKFGSTAGEQAFISVTSQNASGVFDSNIMTLGVRSVSSSGALRAYIEMANSSIYLDNSAGANIGISGANISYTATNHNFSGNVVSPALTGTPTAPTATSGTNTTQVATTAFVQNVVGSAVSAGTNYTTLGQLTNASTNTSYDLTSGSATQRALKSAVSGTVRVKFGLAIDISATPALARVYVNGVAQGSEFSSSTIFPSVTDCTLDISVAPGDRIQIAVRLTAINGQLGIVNYPALGSSVAGKVLSTGGFEVVYY
jgi:hypothetical protein